MPTEQRCLPQARLVPVYGDGLSAAIRLPSGILLKAAEAWPNPFQQLPPLPSKFGSLANLAAIRLASSSVSTQSVIRILA
jgi:hypothetical protein